VERDEAITVTLVKTAPRLVPFVLAEIVSPNKGSNMLSRLLVSVFVVMATACGDVRSPAGSPLIPSAPSSAAPQPPTPSGEQWTLTITSRDFSGPDDCSTYAKYVGESDDWSMTVERSGASIHLDISLLDDPDVHIEYNGTVESAVFTATATQSIRGQVCGGSRVSLRSERRVSGRFSEDGRALTAQEELSSSLTTGETLVFHDDWTAVQK
jgi:hypothetical protein